MADVVQAQTLEPIHHLYYGNDRTECEVEVDAT